MNLPLNFEWHFTILRYLSVAWLSECELVRMAIPLKTNVRYLKLANCVAFFGWAKHVFPFAQKHLMDAILVLWKFFNFYAVDKISAHLLTYLN